jgi:GDP-L-fucose synthase
MVWRWRMRIFSVQADTCPSVGHVIPAPICKLNKVKQAKAKEVVVWAAGAPKRAFLNNKSRADACVFLINLPKERYGCRLGSDESTTEAIRPSLADIDVGDAVTIRELAETVKAVIRYPDEIVYDSTRHDGTPRKLMDVGRRTGIGSKYATDLSPGLANAYALYVENELSRLQHSEKERERC